MTVEITLGERVKIVHELATDNGIAICWDRERS
jgi:hypothetical protein